MSFLAFRGNRKESFSFVKIHGNRVFTDDYKPMVYSFSRCLNSLPWSRYCASMKKVMLLRLELCFKSSCPHLVASGVQVKQLS